VGGSRDFGDLLIGDGNANTLSGLGGDDMLVGASGDDPLNGGLGAAFLQGGSENNTLTGGSDSDIFQYIVTAASSAGARDAITDFDALSEAEVIFLDGLLSGKFQTGISAGGNTGFAAILDGSNDIKVEIDTDGDGSADMENLLLDVAFGDVDAMDFLVT
jgi:Ca2+-binding RTX toxin-like protein